MSFNCTTVEDNTIRSSRFVKETAMYIQGRKTKKINIFTRKQKQIPRRKPKKKVGVAQFDWYSLLKVICRNLIDHCASLQPKQKKKMKEMT